MLVFLVALLVLFPELTDELDVVFALLLVALLFVVIKLPFILQPG